MFIPFKSKIRSFIRTQIRAELEPFGDGIREKIRSDVGNITAPVSKSTCELERAKSPKTAVDLGYFTNNLGPMFEPKLIDNCKLLTDRFAAYPLLKPVLPENAVTAEVGVAYGENTDKILSAIHPAKHFMIDLYEDDDFFGRDEFKNAGTNHEGYIRKKYAPMKHIEVMKGDSSKVLATFPDDYFDYVYLDGDHTYEGVKKDIEVLYNKMKDGGVIQFNDFTFFTIYEAYEYGVLKAVREFLHGSQHEVLFYCLHYSKMDDIVVRLHK